MRVKQWKEYAPMITGLVLIMIGLWLPLGSSGAPRLIDLVTNFASTLISRIF